MLSGVWLSTRLDTRARQRLSSTDRHCSSFTLILKVCRARNVPKSSYSRLYHAGVFVLVVAQQIQDMSAVSLTHKAVGVYLSRLRCGAGLVWPGLRITPTGVIFFPSLVHNLYMAVGRLWHRGIFESEQTDRRCTAGIE